MDAQIPEEKNKNESPHQNFGSGDEYSEYLAYIGDKVQKITRAVYRVTDILSDQEPLKWKMREKAVLVFTNLAFLNNKNFLERTSVFEKLESWIDQLILMFSLFSGDNSISSANFEILKDEYAAVRKAVLQEKECKTFREIFLDGSIKSLASASNEHNANGHANGHANGQKEVLKTKVAVITNKTKNTADKVRRRRKILDVVRDKERVTVGELSNLFTECSGKTIQRDLLEMVRRGLLKKEGEKRWRAYLVDKK